MERLWQKIISTENKWKKNQEHCPTWKLPTKI
jgi:hypothetical protein